MARMKSFQFTVSGFQMVLTENSKQKTKNCLLVAGFKAENLKQKIVTGAVTLRQAQGDRSW